MFPVTLIAQNIAADGSSEFRKDFEIRSRKPSVQPAVNDDNYVQRIEDRIAAALGGNALKVTIAKDREWYARMTAQTLVLSAGFASRIENEAELAGLLAHQRAHMTTMTPCVLGETNPARNRRESERRATAAALGTLERGGYDPSALLDLLSKLSYERSAWSSAIDPEDLLSLRNELERHPIPPEGYRLDSSAFVIFHAQMANVPAAPR